MSMEGFMSESTMDVPSPERAPRGETAPSCPNRSFLAHAAIYGFGALALQAASVILVPLYTRCLTPAEFGVLEMLSRIGEVFSVCLLANGIRLAAFTFYCQATTEQNRKRTATTVIFAQLILLAASALLAAALIPYLDLLTGIDDSTMVLFAILLVMLEGITAVPLTLIQARVESAYYVWVTAAMFCFRVTVTILAVAGFGWGVWGVLGASALTSVLFGAYLTGRELRKSSFLFDARELREVLKFAVPFLPVGVCGMLLHNGDRFFLMNFGGADQVGQYALGYKLVWAVTLLSTGPLCQVWSASMYQIFTLPGASAVVGRANTRILAAYLFAGMGLCIFDEQWLAILAPPSYSAAHTVIWPITLAYFFWIAANLMDATLWVHRRSGLKFWIILASTSVAVTLYALLIPRYGTMGAAYATLVGMLVHCAITCVVSQRVFHVRHEFGRLSVMLGSAVALTAASHHVGNNIPGLLEKLALWLAWPVLLWWTGVATQDEKYVVRAVCRRARSWLPFAPVPAEKPQKHILSE